MLTLLILLATQSAPLAGRMPEAELAEAYRACAALAATDAPAARVKAAALKAAGAPARGDQCRGLAEVAAGRPAEAARVFAAAARDAAAAKDALAPTLWAQAGNAALLAGRPAEAVGHLDRALGDSAAGPIARGLLHADRGRARVLAGDAAGAKADFERAKALAPQDPTPWLLSATLARREGRLVEANADLAVAAGLAPADAAIALEAGAIAIAADDEAQARRQWETAVRLDPDGPTGARARGYLAQLGTPAPPR